MKLSIERYGAGAPLVLLHGWGLHSAIWSPLIPALARRFEIFAVDLPGHGHSALDGAFTLERVSETIAHALPAPAHWLGWSLGGSIALAVAHRYPANVDRLILVATTPRFVRGGDWPHGLDEAILQQFAASLVTDYRGTLQRFLSLQMGAHERDALRALRLQLFARGTPDARALAGGLAILRDADLRATLAHIAAPTLVLQGARDQLVSLAGAQALVQALPQAQLYTLANAGHAPFLAQPESFAQAIDDFIHERRAISAR